LLAGAGGLDWTEAGKAVGLATGIPLQSYRIAPDGELKDPGGLFAATVGIGAQGALLLRPDGVIGWRTRGPHTDPRTRLDEVMRRLTFRR
jgi:putative polyketide hydroxylase